MTSGIDWLTNCIGFAKTEIAPCCQLVWSGSIDSVGFVSSVDDPNFIPGNLKSMSETITRKMLDVNHEKPSCSFANDASTDLSETLNRNSIF